MYGKLDEALKALLEQALPTLFGGDQPLVKLATTSNRFELDANAAEAVASEPRPDDRTDDLPFDATKAEGPYTLTQQPDPGPRRVRLTTVFKDRIALRDEEVKWDPTDPRRFTLQFRPGRVLNEINGVQVMYSITAVYVKLKVAHRFSVELESTSISDADRAESLAVGVIALNRQRLIDQSARSFEDGDYGVQVSVKSFQLLDGTAASQQKRALNFHAEIELKATRVLADDEGKPIKRIRTDTGRVNAQRPVDIQIDVEA